MAKRAQSPATADVLAFPFRDANWLGQFAVGIALLFASFFIPFIPALFVYGYLVRVMRNTIESGRLALPEWNEWGRLGSDGLKAFGIGFSYLLPGLGLILFGTCCYCASIFSLALGDSGSGGISEDALGLLLTMAMIVFFLSLALGSLLSMVGAIPLPIAAGKLAQTSEFSSAFRLRQLWHVLAANPMGFFSAWVVFMGLIGISYALMTITYYTLVLACLIPLLSLPIMLYSMLVGAAEFGLAYREALAKT